MSIFFFKKILDIVIIYVYDYLYMILNYAITPQYVELIDKFTIDGFAECFIETKDTQKKLASIKLHNTLIKEEL